MLLYCMPTRRLDLLPARVVRFLALILPGLAVLWSGFTPCFPAERGASPLELRIAEVKDERPRIVAFGNSLTAGLGVRSQESYPAELQRLLDAAGYRYRVVNAGVSGDTTAGGLRRVPWVLNGRPDIVILELGGNDGLRGLSIEETKANLDRIIERLRDSGALVVLAGMKLPPNYGRDYTSRFEAIYQALARKHGVPLIPFFLEGVAAQAQFNQPDGIHPTADGYRIIAANVLNAIESFLKK